MTSSKDVFIFADTEISTEVRLVDGFSNSSGRIEVLVNGEWGTVCGDEWDLVNANVVCRQLGYRTAFLSYEKPFFGEGTGRIWLTNVICKGDEPSLFECKHDRFLSSNCSHEHDASIICEGKEIHWLEGVV